MMTAARSDRIAAMAAAIYPDVNLDDRADVALCLFAQGYLGKDIGDDLPAVIDAARTLRARRRRNQITDIATTAAAFCAAISFLAVFEPEPAMAQESGGSEGASFVLLSILITFGGWALALAIDAFARTALSFLRLRVGRQ
ncbi:MAG: hypothetical protein KGZ68_04500 [Dechloromonas sp.]|nr:hypothetical protein [Dechloromonas sp.]